VASSSTRRRIWLQLVTPSLLGMTRWATLLLTGPFLHTHTHMRGRASANTTNNEPTTNANQQWTYYQRKPTMNLLPTQTNNEPTTNARLSEFRDSKIWSSRVLRDKKPRMIVLARTNSDLPDRTRLVFSQNSLHYEQSFFLYLWALIYEFFKNVGIRIKLWWKDKHWTPPVQTFNSNGTISRKMEHWTDGETLPFILILCTRCKRNTHYIQNGLFCLVVCLLSVVSYL
jgi:hypothetical protein